MEEMFKKLRYIMKKQIHLRWDIAAFKRYLLENITPKRLRWNVAPNERLDDEDSLSGRTFLIPVTKDYWSLC